MHFMDVFLNRKYEMCICFDGKTLSIDDETKGAIQWTCGECYTTFDLPKDMRCPTCKIRDIVPIKVEVGDHEN